MTNQYLGDGICDVTALQRLGVTMGLGTDADVRPSLLEEMRAASLLQKISRLDGSALGARTALALGTSQGAAALRVDAGALRVGAFADYVTLDVTNVDPWIPLANHVVYRAENSSVRETFVGGVQVRMREQDPPREALHALKSLVPQLTL
jgi:5-methylthioadenosine/S-adenosylhomocysteine deaminase